MPRTKLTKTIVEAAPAGGRDYKLRDALTPGFLLKVTPAGGKVFMLAYTNVQGRRRKPAIGRYGELTVEQARAVARDWLADVRRGEDPCAERTQARLAPDMAGLRLRAWRSPGDDHLLHLIFPDLDLQFTGGRIEAIGDFG